MSGTRNGGLKAAKKNKAKDHNFYVRIGAIGGRNGRTGGFAYINPDGVAVGKEWARVAGAKGGKISKRGQPRNKSEDSFLIMDNEAHLPIILETRPIMWDRIRRK